MSAIIVITDSGDERPFSTAGRLATDEFNNLQIFDTTGDRLVHLFAEGQWREAEVVYGET